MKLHSAEKIPHIKKFKNKEDFCNRIIQEVTTISKNYILTKSSNEKMIKIEDHKRELLSKGKQLDSLLENSSIMQEELVKKTELLVEENNTYRNMLLELLESDGIQK
jgi:hypothetical protein